MARGPDLTYAQCVERLRAPRDAAAARPSVLWQATGSELAEGMEALGELSAVAEGAELALTVEAVDRGEPASASPPVTSREWVAVHHRRYAVVGASRVASVAEACREPRHAVLREAVVSGRVSIGTARVAMSEMRLLKPHLRRDAVDSVWHGLMTLGERHDSRTVRRLRERLLAAHGRDGDCEDTEDRARGGQSLSTGKEVAPDVGGRDRPAVGAEVGGGGNRTSAPTTSAAPRRSSPSSAAPRRPVTPPGDPRLPRLRDAPRQPGAACTQRSGAGRRA